MKTLILVAAWLPLPADGTSPGPAELRAGTFRLRLDVNGRPASLQILPDGEELLNGRDPGPGFSLESQGQASIPLTDVALDAGGRLVARSADGSREAVFSVRASEKYLALRIDSLRGIPHAPGARLTFRMNSLGRAGVTELDYMTETGNSRGRVWTEWKYLSHSHPDDPKGGFALYVKRDDADEDDILLGIWAGENLPRPAVPGEWTLDRARAWVTEWQRLFADRSQMILEGESLADLEAALPYAERARIREIYLFTNTWRTDPFWPSTQVNWHVNRKVFPRGEEDLRAFSDRLAARGMRLNLHYVSGGIGPRDPVYVGSKPDRRLAAWVRGTLAEAAGPEAREILFRPPAGAACPPILPHFFRHDHVRIEDEIVQVQSFEPAGTDTWRLKGCQRGQFLTKAAAHPAGSDAAGLVSAYGQNYVPDNDSTLLDEIAENYAGLINRCRIAHTEYDGAEIHTYNGRWGYLKFASKVYRRLDHPVTAHDSGGSAPRVYFEYRLNSTRQLLRGACPFTHGNWSALVELASPSRPASTRLDAHFVLSQGHLGGALGIAKPEPMFGVTAAMLKAHGQTEAFLQAVQDWKALSSLLTDEQRKRIDDSLGRPKRRTPESSHHAASPVVHVARKAGDRYEIVPIRVLTRNTGDVLWQQGQEHGPVSPRQFVKPGTELTLDNPFAPQPARFIIRVLWALDPAGPSAAPGEAHAPPAAIRPEDLFTAGNEADRVARAAAGPNVNLQESPRKMRAPSPGSISTRVSEEKPGLLRLEAENAGDRETWEFKALPSWGVRVDMTIRRGIAMTVDGDGSGAILLFQVPGRDYVVPIDFKGPRVVEIPNGEVAWADGRWGWRMETKSAHYGRVGWCRLGFGYLPPRTRASVTVEGLRALAEIPVVLTDPAIRVGSGTLKVKGRVVSGQILAWEGGPSAAVYDENWNRVRDLPVEARDYVMPSGGSTVSVAAAAPAAPWLDVQFMTEGEPMRVPAR
jgi:hypothetical protein